MLHSCPSFSCLLTLEEKPNCLSGMTLRSQSRSQEPATNNAAISRPIPILSQRPTRTSLIDALFQEQNSPTTVVFDGDFFAVNASCEKTVEDSHLDSNRVGEEPLNTLDGPSNHTRIRRVHFHPTVAVSLIPSHRDYSDAHKQILWASTEEIRVNAVKAQMELSLYEHLFDDESSEAAAHHDDCQASSEYEYAEPEHNFIPLARMQRAR